MKYSFLILLIGSLSLGVGYADPSNPRVLPAVGPAPTAVAKAGGQGSLRVFSVREKHDPSYLWDIFVGERNDDARYDAAHTDYTICTREGKVVQKVRNAHDPNDANPAQVLLAPGTYLVKAEARDYGLVTVPVVIKPGQVTVVNLERQPRPSVDQAPKDELVWLYGYRIVGWRAEPERHEGWAATPR